MSSMYETQNEHLVQGYADIKVIRKKKYLRRNENASKVLKYLLRCKRENVLIFPNTRKSNDKKSGSWNKCPVEIFFLEDVGQSDIVHWWILVIQNRKIPTKRAVAFLLEPHAEKERRWTIK